MRYPILLFATVAISVPETSLSARTQEMSSLPVTRPRLDADFHITRVEQVSADADSLQATAGASLEECRPPEWLGTVHTHVARIDGRPYVTFSGSDRAVMAAWHRQWQVDGVFCVLYDDRRAHCEAGDDRSGDPVYAYARGNNLAQ